MSTERARSNENGRSDEAIRSVDVLLDGIRALEEHLAVFRKQFATANDLTVTDTQLLTTLAAAGRPVTASELKDAVRLTSGTVTAMLDRLERAGLASRRPNPDDRRSVLVALEPAGLAAVDSARDVLAAALHETLDPAAQTRIGRELRELARAVSGAVAIFAAAGGAAPPRP
jgi:DNA-binding MarR family transcriptional regulator